MCAAYGRPRNALMAELVDALVSGTSDESRGGSSPLQGTKFSFAMFMASTSSPPDPPKALNLPRQSRKQA